MNLRKSQQGFSILMALGLLIVVFALGYGVWRFLSKHEQENLAELNQSSQTTTEEETTQAVEQPEIVTYASPYEGLKFDYPQDWKKDSTPVSELEAQADYLTITSPDGTEVEWSSYIDGIGGHCDPEVDGTVSVAAYEELPNLPDIYYVELKREGKLSEIGLMEDILGEPIKAGDTGQCMLPTYLQSRKNQNGVWLRSIEFDPTNAEDMAALKQILLSARY